MSLSTVRTGYPGRRCAGTGVCSGLNGSRARYDGMGRARRGTIPPPNARYVPSITVPLSTNTSSTACVGKSHFALGTVARYGNGMVEHGVGGVPTPRFLPSHTTVPMGPHPPNTAGRPQGACGLAPVPRPTWRMPTAWPTDHAPPRPTSAAHALHSGAGMVHKAAPMSCTTEPHRLCPPQSSRVYRAPGENIAAGWPCLSRDVLPSAMCIAT